MEYLVNALGDQMTQQAKSGFEKLFDLLVKQGGLVREEDTPK